MVDKYDILLPESSNPLYFVSLANVLSNCQNRKWWAAQLICAVFFFYFPILYVLIDSTIWSVDYIFLLWLLVFFIIFQEGTLDFFHPLFYPTWRYHQSLLPSCSSIYLPPTPLSFPLQQNRQTRSLKREKKRRENCSYKMASFVHPIFNCQWTHAPHENTQRETLSLSLSHENQRLFSSV